MKKILNAIWNGIKKVGSFLWVSVSTLVFEVATTVTNILLSAVSLAITILKVVLYPIIRLIVWLFRQVFMWCRALFHTIFWGKQNVGYAKSVES